MVAEGCDLYSVALHMQGWPVQANHRNDFSLPYSKYKRAKWTIFFNPSKLELFLKCLPACNAPLSWRLNIHLKSSCKIFNLISAKNKYWKQV